MAEYNVRQMKAINGEENKILCLAAAGSGKTYVLIERIKRYLKEGTDPKDIIAISFTNQAAEEVQRRVGKQAKGAFIGTIHSLANKICHENNIPTSQYILNEEFDKLLDKALTIPSRKYPKVKYLLIDEFQDIDERQWNFFNKIQAENFFAVADDRQAIYGFKGSSLKFLDYLYYDPDCAVYNLNTNYRCPPNIIRFAEDFLSNTKKISVSASAPKDKKNGLLEECSFSDAIEDLEYMQDYGNWAILCRTNAEVEIAMEILTEKGIPCFTFKKMNMTQDEMKKILDKSEVKVLTIHCGKGLSFKNVIVSGAKTFNDEERRISYVAATRAEQNLYWTPSINVGVKRRKKALSSVSQKVKGGIVSFE